MLIIALFITLTNKVMQNLIYHLLCNCGMLLVTFSSLGNANIKTDEQQKFKSDSTDDNEPLQELEDRPLTLKECFRTRLKMDDDNYRNVINWYKSCVKLSETKNGRQKDAYTMRLIQNLLRSTSEFFSQTKLADSTISEIEKDCSSLVDKILYPASLYLNKDDMTKGRSLKKGNSCSGAEGGGGGGGGGGQLESLLNHIRWAAFVASLLILLIFVLLLYFCMALILRKKHSPCHCGLVGKRFKDGDVGSVHTMQSGSGRLGRLCITGRDRRGRRDRQEDINIFSRSPIRDRSSGRDASCGCRVPGCMLMPDEAGGRSKRVRSKASRSPSSRRSSSRSSLKKKKKKKNKGDKNSMDCDDVLST